MNSLSPPSGRLRTIGLLLLTALTIGVYGQTLRHEFIYWDDTAYVTENPHVAGGLRPENMAWAFSAFHSNNWHPLTWLSHMLDCQLYGLNPAGHHATSLLLHLAGSLLCFCVLRRMTGKETESLLVAGLFALHPLQVESVAWIAERKNVLSTLLWLLTMLFYLRYAERPTRRRYLATGGIFALGLMAKPMLVTLPAVLLLIDFWPLRRCAALSPGRLPARSAAFLVAEKTPLLLLSAASSIITVLAQQSGGAVRTLEVFSLPVRLANALTAYAAYIGLTFWPAGLAPLYPHPGMPTRWSIIAAAALLGALLGIGCKTVRRCPFILTGLLWFLITLLPVIGIIQVGSQARADRYMQIPILGLLMATVWTAAAAARGPASKKVLAVIALVSLGALGFLSWRQAARWSDHETLFRHTVAVTRNNYVARASLGTWLAQHNRIGEALTQFEISLAIEPQYVKCRYNYAQALLAAGRTPEAVRQFYSILRLQPEHAGAHRQLGAVYARQGRLLEALRHLESALHSCPADAEAHVQLGLVLGREWLFADAARHFRTAAALAPQQAGLSAQRTALQELLTQTRAALRAAQQELARSPESPALLFKLGNLHRSLGEPEQALDAYARALAADSSLAQQLSGLDIACCIGDTIEQPLSLFTRVAQLQPESARACYTVASLYALQSARAAAAAWLQRAAAQDDTYRLIARYDRRFAAVADDVTEK